MNHTECGQGGIEGLAQALCTNRTLTYSGVTGVQWRVAAEEGFLFWKAAFALDSKRVLRRSLGLGNNNLGNGGAMYLGQVPCMLGAPSVIRSSKFCFQGIFEVVIVVQFSKSGIAAPQR